MNDKTEQQPAPEPAYRLTPKGRLGAILIHAEIPFAQAETIVVELWAEVRAQLAESERKHAAQMKGLVEAVAGLRAGIKPESRGPHADVWDIAIGPDYEESWGERIDAALAAVREPEGERNE